MDIMKNEISARKILDFYEGCEKNGILNHGLIIEKDGKTLFENYVYPFSENMPHTLFSVTKSLVSTAVGFAIYEGLFDLETKISPFFNEYIQAKGTENISVRDLLTMHSGKKFSFLQDMTGDYVEIFMKSGFRKKNGFLYSNNDVHILSALIQKLTGMTVCEYLVPRLFDPLGIDTPEWETDCNGICVGGTGSYLKLRDLIKIMGCYINGGKFEGKQIIPEFWTVEATKKQIDFDENNPLDDGYGYLFWTYRDYFSMNGLFGQMIFGYPKKNLVIGLTNCTVEDIPLLDLTDKLLVGACGEPSSDETVLKLSEYLSSKDEKIIISDIRNDVPSGTFKMTEISKALAGLFFPACLIPRSISSSMAKRPKKSFDNFSFKAVDNEVDITWHEENDEVVVKCGLDGNPRVSNCSIKGYKYTLEATGWWEEKSLHINLHPINTLSSLNMIFRFEENAIFLKSIETPSFYDFIMRNMTQVNIIAKVKPIKAIATGVMNLLLNTIDMEMKLKK